MELGDVIKSLDEHPKDIVNLFSENLNDKIIKFKIRYKQSQKTMDFVKRGTKKIINFVTKELQNKK